ncbi:hypothetical protein [Meiothermus sp. CFH 77666]|uniref:hypothetical protein n=1 Tax=Meiothermus sp. CFH 77666 TaxID=2817942 RepID=UPI001AA082E6|nr:hypothetical protein [Meiothermus sp. CFH 77666]MBO1435613.1 hypothetical protein [Meiothermus sp. CFH 77666]
MKPKRTLWLLALGALSLMLTACPGPGATKGVLEITVNAPAGVTPNVQVSGPGTTSSISSTGKTTLNDRQPGNYTITVNKVVAGGIGYNGQGATVVVEAGKKTSYTVDYAAVSGKIVVSISGLPAGLEAGINIKKSDSSNLNSAPINADTTLEDVPPGTYTIEAPARTQGSSTYATAADGSTLTVTAGGTATVNATYTPNPGSATINVAGLDAALPNPVQLTLTGGPSSPVNQSFTDNGPVTFNNLAPGTYTISANAITDNGPQDYAFTLSQATLSISSGGSASATLTYSKPTLSVSLSGLPQQGTALTLTVAAQPSSGSPTTWVVNNQSLPVPGPATLTLPRLGSYTVSAYGASAGQPVRVVGQVVDSLLTSNTQSVTVSNASASATLTFSDGQTGRVFVAGNGAFDSDADAGYTITDFQLAQASPSLVPFTGGSGASAAGLFKVKFDAQGNLYLMYQYLDTANRARIVRISAANLAAGNFSPSASGNKTITTDALGNDPEPADLAFDASGNLWVVNDFESRLVCISAAALSSAGDVTAPSAVYTSNVPVRPQDSFTLTANIHAIAFDGAGNLWFTAGDYRADVVTGTAPTQTVTYGRRAVLARINASALTCSSGTHASPANLLASDIPVRLDISNAARVYEASPGTATTVNPTGTGPRGILKPVALVYDAASTALWVGDYGGSNGLTGAAFRDADADQETLIRVPLNTANTDPNGPANPMPDGYDLREAQIDHRISIGYTATPGTTSTGLQQVFALAFDKTGALWIVANNNVLLTASDTSPGPSDRRGKLYRVQIPARETSLAQWAVQNLTPGDILKTISAPLDGIGFAGLAFNRFSVSP